MWFSVSFISIHTTHLFSCSGTNLGTIINLFSFFYSYIWSIIITLIYDPLLLLYYDPIIDSTPKVECHFCLFPQLLSYILV